MSIIIHIAVAAAVIMAAAGIYLIIAPVSSRRPPQKERETFVEVKKAGFLLDSEIEKEKDTVVPVSGAEAELERNFLSDGEVFVTGKERLEDLPDISSPEQEDDKGIMNQENPSEDMDKGDSVGTFNGSEKEDSNNGSDVNRPVEMFEDP